jgi:hypothetical protein
VANVALFAVLCAEVVVLLRIVADARVAIIGGILFAVFPSHGESVAWIAGNTDLLAATFGLGALVIGMRLRPTIAREVCVGMLTALAMLAKEIAVGLPVLMAILIWARPGGEAEGSPRTRWRPAVVMLTAVVAELVIRAFVVSGFGGYGGNAFTAKRGAGSLVSFTVGALSAPQLPVLAHPVLLLVPLCSLALICWGAYRAWASEGLGITTRLALAGAAWFFVSLIPVLNEPLNLNTGSGDRLLLLPSVGLALTAAAVIARRPSRAVTGIGAALASLCGLACVLNAIDWHTAGVESRRVLASISTLSPPHAHLIALSVPADYRQAHLYPDALDVAMQESGRPDITLTACIPVHALSLRAGQASFRPLRGGAWLGRSTRSAPFNVPVLGGPDSQRSNGCTFEEAPRQPRGTLGTALVAIVRPLPASGGSIQIYFDGRDMRSLSSTAMPGGL